MRYYLAEYNRGLPAAVRDLLPQVTYPQFFTAVSIVTLIPFLLMAIPEHRSRHGRRTLALLVFQMVMLLNACAHVASAATASGYTPGLATAIGINFPFSVLLFREAVRSEWLTTKTLGVLVLPAALLHGPGLLGLMMVSRALTDLLDI